MDESQELIAELVGALSFYADKAQWRQCSDEPWKLIFHSDGMDGDGYEVAKQALAKAAANKLDTSFQSRVLPWLVECFGEEIAADKTERNHRFLEEALELVQATGCTQSEAHQLVDYVYGREIGDPPQEVGGVMNTLAALCLAHGMDMHDCGEVELARVWTKVEKIRAKQKAKPKHSPLPQHVNKPEPTCVEVDMEHVAKIIHSAMLWAYQDGSGNTGPKWQGGNSFAEDEARQKAHRAISEALTTRTVADVRKEALEEAECVVVTDGILNYVGCGAEQAVRISKAIRARIPTQKGGV